MAFLLVIYMDRSQIHGCTISLRFLGIMLRVLSLEVSVSVSQVTVNSKEDNAKIVVLSTSKNSASCRVVNIQLTKNHNFSTVFQCLSTKVI